MELTDTVSEERQRIVQHDRLALFAGSAGIFLSTLDSGIMNVALPSLCTAFSCDFHAIQRMLLNLGNSVGGAIAALLLGLQAGERQSSLGISWWFAVLFLSTGLAGLLFCSRRGTTGVR